VKGENNYKGYEYDRAAAPELPTSFKWSRYSWLLSVAAMPNYFVKHYMKPTFRGFRRGDVCFAANVLGAREALLLVLVHFFEHARWGSPVETGVAEQNFTTEDLFILTQATLYLATTRGPPRST
jgi:hypothetical protein